MLRLRTRCCPPSARWQRWSPPTRCWTKLAKASSNRRSQVPAEHRLIREASMTIALYVAAAVIMAVGSLYFAWRNRDSQISGGRILRIIGYFVLSLSRRCFGASVGNRFCRNTSDQRWPIHRPFHPLLALFLFWLRQEEARSNLPPIATVSDIAVLRFRARFRFRAKPSPSPSDRPGWRPARARYGLHEVCPRS